MKGKILSAMLLMCMITLNMAAQGEATIKSFVETTDHISGNNRRNDLNGNPCALVKVQVVDEIVRVEGNRIGNIVNKGVEKWVYMCKGSRNMRIHLKNHLPVKVMFQDYKINGLESNRVYELVIESTDIPNQTGKQKLTINYAPSHAMVLIDSKSYRGNGRIETELPVGEHRYIIAAEGYITAEGTVRLNEQGAREITERLTAEATSEISDQPSVNQPIKDNPQQPMVSQQTTENSYQDLRPVKTKLHTNTTATGGLKRGFKGYVEAGYSVGIDYYDGGFLARAAFGFQFNPHIFAGLGVGLSFYDYEGYYDDSEESMTLPIFANFRYTMLNKRISPFFDIKAGYSPEVDDGEGFFASPALGCRFAIGKQFAITTSISFEYQQGTVYYYDYDYEYEDVTGLALKVGFEF